MTLARGGEGKSGVGMKGFLEEATLGPGLQGGWDPPKYKGAHKRSTGWKGIMLGRMRRAQDSCRTRGEIRRQGLRTGPDT